LANNEAEQTGSFPNPASRLETRVAKFPTIPLYIGMGNAIAMMLLTVTHAISRYAFNNPLLGLVSISSLLLATMIFAVGSYTQVVKGHVIVGIFVDRLSERKRAIVDGFTYTLCLVIVTLAFWQSILKAITMIGAKTLTEVGNFPQFAVYFIIAFGWGSFSLILVLQLRHIFKKAFGRKKN